MEVNAHYIQFVSQLSQVTLGMCWAQMKIYFKVYVGVIQLQKYKVSNLL